MAKKKARRRRARKGISKDWGRKEGTQVEHIPCKIVVPAGKCPVELSDCDEISVSEWIIDLTDLKPKEYTYAPSVYKYWVRHFYDFWTPEFKQAQEIIDKLVTCDVKTVADLESKMPSVLSS